MRIVASFLTVLCFLFVPFAVQAGAERRDLLLAMNQALASRKPIFDCACLDRKVVSGWYPPKDGSIDIQISFRTASSGETYGAHVIKSSGFRLCDEAAMRAIEKRKFFYVPTDEAELVFDFNFVRMHPRGVSIVLPPYKQEPAVVFVKSKYESEAALTHPGCLEHTAINNDGIVYLLNGNFAAAEKSFEEANKIDPSYEPAVHNLNWVRERKKLGVQVFNRL